MERAHSQGRKFYHLARMTIVLLLLSIGFSMAQDYLWPTNASTLMTSSFCEFRPRHYHAAIDIKTWNRTGYKVFAIADGYIMRVRVSAFGYGKAIYLKLKDGNIVVYAHLDRFAPQLEKYVREIRLARKQYRVDLHLKPNQFPVKRGQLIAYTGKTGIGVPHLHFEIRNSKNEPINPLLFYRSVIKDQLAPLFYEAAFLPLSHRASINFKPDTLFLKFKPQSQIALSDTFYFTGQVGIALKIFDLANGARNHFSFYSAKLWIDDSLVYHLKYDSFSYPETHLVELDKNFSIYRKGYGIFHNFFKHPENNLPFYQNVRANAGVIDTQQLPPGLHRMHIQVKDFSGNLADFRFHFISNPILDFSYDQWKLNNQDLFVRLIASEKLSRILVFQKSARGNWIFIPSYQILSVLNYKDKYYYSLSVPVKSNPEGWLLKFVGVKKNSTSTFPLFAYGNPDLLKLTSQVSAFNIRRNWIELVLQNPEPGPNTMVNTLNKTLKGSTAFPLAPGIFQINVPWTSFQQRRSILASLLPDSLPQLALISPFQQRKIVSKDGRFEARFPVKSFYDNTIVYLTTLKDTIFPEESNSLYRRFGKTYRLQPFDQPINNAVTIKLTIPSKFRQEKGLGLYYRDRKKGWTFLSALTDSANAQFTSRVTSLETFSIIQDTIAPLIRPLQKVRQDTLYSQKGYLSFLVKDEMAGIRKESQIQIFSNEQWQLFEYDPEEDRVSLFIPSKIRPVRLKIEVIDNVGNRVQKIYWVK